MTTNDIHYFLTVAKIGNITLAAKQLYITQPTLSRSIRQLETELGCVLFNRQRGKQYVELTEIGKALLPVAERWMDAYVETKNIATLSQNKVYTITASDSLNNIFLPKVYERFLVTHPNVSLGIRTHFSYESYDILENGLADIGIITIRRYSKKVETIPAFSERMYFICSIASGYPNEIHPNILDPKMEIRIPWTSEYDMWHSRWFSTAIRPKAMVANTTIVKQLLLNEGNWAILPASFAQLLNVTGQYRYCDIIDGPSDRICYYIRTKNRKEELDCSFLNLVNDQVLKMPGTVSFLHSL